MEWLKPISCPRLGNNRAARMLKKNITEMAWAISSSSASITGAAAAMADPPHIDDPTPMSVAMWSLMRPVLMAMNATKSELDIVDRIIGSDSLPVFNTRLKSSPNPRRITAYCRIFLEVNLTPSM